MKNINSLAEAIFEIVDKDVRMNLTKPAQLKIILLLNQSLENIQEKWTDNDLMEFYKYVKTHTVSEAFEHIMMLKKEK